MANVRSADKGLLVKLGVGILPIPIVGDIALAMGFYDIFSKSDSSMRSLKYAGIPAALLTRYALYADFYRSLWENFFSK